MLKIQLATLISLLTPLSWEAGGCNVSALFRGFFKLSTYFFGQVLETYVLNVSVRVLSLQTHANRQHTQTGKATRQMESAWILVYVGVVNIRVNIRVKIR